MSIYAQIVNGSVLNVIVADSEFIATQTENTYVILTRGGIGWKYDGENFIAPQPHASWTLDSNHDWQPPTAEPDDGKMYAWNESQLKWVAVS